MVLTCPQHQVASHTMEHPTQSVLISGMSRCFRRCGLRACTIARSTGLHASCAPHVAPRLNLPAISVMGNCCVQPVKPAVFNVENELNLHLGAGTQSYPGSMSLKNLHAGESERGSLSQTPWAFTKGQSKRTKMVSSMTLSERLRKEVAQGKGLGMGAATAPLQCPERDKFWEGPDLPTRVMSAELRPGQLHNELGFRSGSFDYVCSENFNNMQAGVAPRISLASCAVCSLPLGVLHPWRLYPNRRRDSSAVHCCSGSFDVGATPHQAAQYTGPSH